MSLNTVRKQTFREERGRTKGRSILGNGSSACGDTRQDWCVWGLGRAWKVLMEMAGGVGQGGLGLGVVGELGEEAAVGLLGVGVLGGAELSLA